jgi:hypothetical protein
VTQQKAVEDTATSRCWLVLIEVLRFNLHWYKTALLCSAELLPHPKMWVYVELILK